MTVQELTLVINKMTDDERLILSEYAECLMKKRNKRKTYTKAELLNRVEDNNKLIRNKEMKSSKTFLAEIRKSYGISA